MKRGIFIALATLGLCLIAGVLVNRWRGQGPLYHGKTIKAWARQFDSVSPQAREESAAAFRAMRVQAVPELIRLVESRDPIWRKALWATALKLPPGMRSGLVRHSRVPEEYVIHSFAARALATIGPEAKPAIPALERMLRSKENEPRWDAATALGRIGKDSVPVLTGAVRDANPDIRYAAIDGLAQLGAGAEPAIPALLERLKEEKQVIRAAAISCLAGIGPPAAPALVKAIEHEKGLVRQGAARAIMSLGVSRRLVEPALLLMLQDEEAASRQQAIAPLSAHAYDEPAITAITAALKDPAPEVRVAAAKGLGEVSRKAQPAVPVLIEALKDESSAVRSSAANTLGIIGSPAKAALPELIRLSADSDETVRAAATEAAGKVQAGEGK